MIQIEQYKKSYGGAIVLDVPKLEIPFGVHWIKGKNGSGKTTFFKSVAGLLPFEGEIILNDISLKRHSVAYRRQVNYGEAEPYYPAFLTAKDLIQFVARAKRASATQIDFMLEQLDMHSFYEKSCGTYSSGYAQKIVFSVGFSRSSKRNYA